MLLPIERFGDSLSGRKQNRRQKVVNRGALRLCEGAFRSCRGNLTFKFDKNSTNL